MLTLHGHYMDGNRSVNIALTAQMKNAIEFRQTGQKRKRGGEDGNINFIGLLQLSL